MKTFILAAAVTAASVVALSTGARAQVGQLPDVPVTTGGVDTPARADARPQQWRWTLGLGPAIVPEYEGSDESQLVPLPFVKAQKGPYEARLLGLHLTSNVIPDPNWRFGPSINVRRGYDDVDQKPVRQLDVDREFELGVKGGYDFPIKQALFAKSTLSLATEFLADVSDKSNGYVITPSITYKMLLSERWDAAIGGDFTYASDGYMSYYFGVSDGDAAKTGLDEHGADADVKNTALNLSVGYAITEAWRANLFGQYRRLFGDAKNSPIVDDKGDANNLLAGLVISYTW
jgi:outer membrane protein